MNGTANSPYVLRRDEGEALWFLGNLVTLKATGAQTRGRLTVAEFLNPPGSLLRCTATSPRTSSSTSCPGPPSSAATDGSSPPGRATSCSSRSGYRTPSSWAQRSRCASCNSPHPQGSRTLPRSPGNQRPNVDSPTRDTSTLPRLATQQSNMPSNFSVPRPSGEPALRRGGHSKIADASAKRGTTPGPAGQRRAGRGWWDSTSATSATAARRP